MILKQAGSGKLAHTHTHKPTRNRKYSRSDKTNMDDDLLDVLDGVDDDDPCFVHVSSIILRTMKIKHDKWAKLMATIQYKVSVV